MKPEINLDKPRQLAFAAKVDSDYLITSMNQGEDIEISISSDVAPEIPSFKLCKSDYKSPYEAMEEEGLKHESFSSEKILRGYSNYVISEIITEKLVKHIKTNFMAEFMLGNQPFFLEIALLCNSNIFVDTLLNFGYGSCKESQQQIYFTDNERQSYAVRLASKAFDDTYHIQKLTPYDVTDAVQFEEEHSGPLLLQITVPFNCDFILDDQMCNVYSLKSAVKNY